MLDIGCLPCKYAPSKRSKQMEPDVNFFRGLTVAIPLSIGLWYGIVTAIAWVIK